MERRKNTRVSFQTMATLSFSEKEKYPDCQTKDLSLKGVFVKGISGRTVGEHCSMILELTGASPDIKINAQGKVAWVTDGGIGVHFEEVDIDSFFHLKNIVYYNAEHSGSE